MKLSRNLRFLITVCVTLLVWGHVLWDHFHGGIPVHYLFMDKNMPPFPNWLGGIILPFFTWIALYRIHKRVDAPDSKNTLRLAVGRFLAALLVAASISVCFENGIEIPNYILYSIFVLAFIFPLYKSEYVLGWVLGSSYSFGAMIPMLFGIVLAGVFFVFYKVGRALIKLFSAKKS
ncbi:hypothetical protein [Allomuricauda sp. SCSIO 65647]|uniref:hypothetical protein n=1 Tax=Allomuricauda sp. SCSIO 65647 TaxID=2908843 RepID=UPI001F47296D|nr:hypothetical protein [Muricauda sp. SCSIO 65647]UJH67741.1 hypothetical protein L0P89_00640 [Muricauda sp. SCSIO 65647]